jgi:hypothetical protein
MHEDDVLTGSSAVALGIASKVATDMIPIVSFIILRSEQVQSVKDKNVSDSVKCARQGTRNELNAHNQNERRITNSIAYSFLTARTSSNSVTKIVARHTLVPLFVFNVERWL